MQIVMIGNSAAGLSALETFRKYDQRSSVIVISKETVQGNDHFRKVGTFGGENPPARVSIDAVQKCYVNLSIK